MSDLKLKVDKQKLDAIIKNEPEEADRWLRGIAFQIVGDIKLSFGTSPDGRAYQRENNGKSKGVIHIASVPGYPPNVDTGSLRASIDAERLGHLKYIIHDGVEYGVSLEFGKERVAPRPFMKPVFDDWQKKILDDAKSHFGNLFK